MNMYAESVSLRTTRHYLVRPRIPDKGWFTRIFCYMYCISVRKNYCNFEEDEFDHTIMYCHDFYPAFHWKHCLSICSACPPTSSPLPCRPPGLIRCIVHNCVACILLLCPRGKLQFRGRVFFRVFCDFLKDRVFRDFPAFFELFCCTTRTHSALFGQQRLIVAAFYSNMTSAYTRDL